MHRFYRLVPICLVAFSLQCATGDTPPTSDSAPPAAATKPAPPAEVVDEMSLFSPEQIRAHTRFLSDDLLEGRAPGTRGDEIAEQYIASQFLSMGLQPAGDDGTFFQKVPLVGIRTVPEKTSMAFVAGGRRMPLKLMDQLVVTDETQTGNVPINASLVFVGHGVVAPEYSWNDYKGVDVRGKVVVALADDPPANPAEPGLFGGDARTYYGRWTYKYEEALRQGAAGAILVHTDASAGYGWNVVRNSWARERPYVKLETGEPALKMAAWITEETGRALMSLAGRDLSQLIEAARHRDFQAVPLNVVVAGTIISDVKPIDTANVIARLEGGDPARRDQAVLYTAHFDHLGVGTPVDGDAIYNGALDNATGVGVLLEIARVWSMTNPRPPRSIVFAAVTAEEGGLRGSEYYAAHPVVPPGKTVVDLNFDSINEFGKVKSVTMLGVERTTFYPTALKVTMGMGLRVDPDQHPEQGSYYRSDHFSMAKTGVPSFSIRPGSDYLDKPEGWGSKQFDEYNRTRYHQPSDEFDPSWDFAEGAQIAKLGYWLGWEAASLESLPTWKRGDEFLSVREKTLRAGEK